MLEGCLQFACWSAWDVHGSVFVRVHGGAWEGVVILNVGGVLVMVFGVQVME